MDCTWIAYLDCILDCTHCLAHPGLHSLPCKLNCKTELHTGCTVPCTHWIAHWIAPGQWTMDMPRFVNGALHCFSYPGTGCTALRPSRAGCVFNFLKCTQLYCITLDYTALKGYSHNLGPKLLSLRFFRPLGQKQAIPPNYYPKYEI